MHPLTLLEPHQLGWFGANPHLWVPPALLGLFLLGLLARRIWQARRRPGGPGQDQAREEGPAREITPHAPAPPPAGSETAPPAPEEAPPEDTAPASLSGAVAKTRAGLLGRIGALFSGAKMDEGIYEALEEILIASDVGVRASAALLGRLRERAAKEEVSTPAALRELLRQELRAVLGKAPPPGAEVPEGPRPWVVMVNGVNGTGKTTTIGKLAHRLTAQGHSVLLGAADTFRAAATEQLAHWAGRAGAELVKGRPESDPGAVAFDAVKAAASRGAQVVLIDTAGRLHTKSNLMDELGKIKRVLGKALEGAPQEVWLVIDGNTGQNAAVQVRQFHEALGLTGLVVTKLDGTAKGGALFGIVEEFGLPVRYVGVGERSGDLVPFDPDAFVDALFEDPS